MHTDSRDTPLDLTGSVALVTGGGRGLGRAFALALAAAGARVVATARIAAQVTETVDLIELSGGTALAMPGDVSMPDDVACLVTAAEQLGPVDILVNNAGVCCLSNNFSFFRLINFPLARYRQPVQWVSAIWRCVGPAT